MAELAVKSNTPLTLGLNYGKTLPFDAVAFIEQCREWHLTVTLGANDEIRLTWWHPIYDVAGAHRNFMMGWFQGKPENKELLRAYMIKERSQHEVGQ